MAKRELALREQPHVTASVADAHARFPRFHDLYDGLTWRLCRDPVPDEAVEIEPETFMVKSAEWSYPGFCIITLVYTVDQAAEMITIEDLWVDEQTASAS